MRLRMRVPRGRERGLGGSPIDGGAVASARERALSFALAQGDDLVRCRARAIVDRAEAPALARAYAAIQRDDGAVAQGSSTALAQTRRALTALLQVGVVQGEPVERAVRWLVRTQCSDGSWQPAEDATEDVALELTGRTVGALARTRCARARALDAAADWLFARFSPERVQGFAFGALRAYAAAFANVPHEGSDAILQWCGRELERGFRSGAFDAVRTASVLADCDAPTLPGSRLAAREVAAALLREQAPDGGWPAREGGGLACRSARTLDALAGLSRLAID